MIMQFPSDVMIGSTADAADWLFLSVLTSSAVDSGTVISRMHCAWRITELSEVKLDLENSISHAK